MNVDKMVERLTGLVDRVGELSDDETLWLLAYLIGAVPDAVTAACEYVEMKR